MRNAWCREQGLYPAELDAWKQDAIAGLGEPRAASAAEARQDRRRGKQEFSRLEVLLRVQSGRRPQRMLRPDLRGDA
jgi:hypothetical protein